MFGDVSMIRSAAKNPATSPELTEALQTSVNKKRVQLVSVLKQAASQFPAITFANSFGAEDMVLTDVIVREQLPIEIFSLDTGRLPVETYELMAETESKYGIKLKVYFPKHETVEDYVQSKGINAFYESIELRKACCHMRKVEPLGRALKGKQAWITGMLPWAKMSVRAAGGGKTLKTKSAGFMLNEAKTHENPKNMAS